MKYKFKVKPYRHQVKAIKQATKQLKKTGGFGLLMEPRTGKTKTAIDLAGIYHQGGKVNRVLVICPLSVIGVWVKEIHANCPFPHQVVVWDKDGRKERKLPLWGRDILDFVIINYDAFSVPGAKLSRGRRSRTRGGKYDVKKALLKWQPQMMILDESHRIKSPSAAKTRIIHSLGNQVPYRLALTGTVQTKKKRVLDIYSQWKFVNPNSPLVAPHTSKSFNQEFGVWIERNGYPQWIRAKNSAKLRKLLHAEAYSVTRAECYDLPPRRDQIIPVLLSGHSAEIYEEMAEEMIAKIKTGEITEASIKLVQSLRLAQITSGLAKTTPTEEHPNARLLRVGRDKLNTFAELVSDLFEADEKIVVAARFRADIAGVRQVCQKLRVPVFELHGGVKGRSARDEQIAGFQRQEGAACFIMQPSAGSLGIDLSTASIFIWFSLTNSWVDFTQAEDRIALSNQSTIFMYLLCPGTVDTLLYESLREDGEIGRLVMRAPERLWVPGAQVQE